MASAQAIDGPAALHWCLRRNCSLTPRQFAAGLLLPFVPGALIGIGAWLAGWVWVPVFIVVVLGGVLLAGVLHGRHASDREVVVLDHGELCIEDHCADRHACVRLNAAWVRVELPEGPRGLVLCRASGRAVRLGRHVPADRRADIARELRRALLQQADGPGRGSARESDNERESVDECAIESAVAAPPRR